MKTLLVLCLLVVVSLANVPPHPSVLPPPPRFPQIVVPHPERGCLYVQGRCYEQCPENTHAYTSGCGDAVSQRTCDEPESRQLGTVCDLSRCDCDEPFVKDKASDKCVLKSDCPKKTIVLD